MSRQDMKEKREQIKELTFKINMRKKEIDSIQGKLDKKEDERKLMARTHKNEIGGFDDEDGSAGEVIIDEEELKLLKELKDSKRDYRDNYSKLKGLKEEMQSLQFNIDTSKEQLIL